MELESTRASYPPQPMQPGSSMAVLHKDSIYAQQTTQQVHGTQSPHLSKLQAGSSLHSAADIGPQAYKRPRLHTDQMRTEPCMPLTVDTQIKQVRSDETCDVVYFVEQRFGLNKKLAVFFPMQFVCMLPGSLGVWVPLAAISKAMNILLLWRFVC